MPLPISANLPSSNVRLSRGGRFAAAAAGFSGGIFTPPDAPPRPATRRPLAAAPPRPLEELLPADVAPLAAPRPRPVPRPLPRGGCDRGSGCSAATAAAPGTRPRRADGSSPASAASRACGRAKKSVKRRWAEEEGDSVYLLEQQIHTKCLLQAFFVFEVVYVFFHIAAAAFGVHCWCTIEGKRR